MRSAADVEDRSEKHIVTPGRIVPARELLGEMLLALKRPAEALKEFEASRLREPERFRGYYGAAQAAAQRATGRRRSAISRSSSRWPARGPRGPSWRRPGRSSRPIRSVSSAGFARATGFWGELRGGPSRPPSKV
jgi:hypothetical protein